MTEFPADIPVTRPPGPAPPPALTVATPLLPLDQDPPAVASPNWVVNPTHTVNVPVIAATDGNVFTIITLSAVAGPLK